MIMIINFGIEKCAALSVKQGRRGQQTFKSPKTTMVHRQYCGFGLTLSIFVEHFGE